MDQAPPLRHPGAEPVPGYRLIEPLGRGGFGEVWKCEAPGGLFKAIKFVGGDGASGAASQERAALERVKALRHPFILSLERVENLGGYLVIVMELADTSLHGVYAYYREQGQVGLPRDELLGYLTEAAEALDWMNFEHGLQHLDVKPHNLFVVCNHIKVADFGLVHRLGDDQAEQSAQRKGGVTPLYSAPEILRGTLSRHSDQYSLAVVYQQLLTGTVPFWHEDVYELMMQHLTGEPDLAALGEEDRAIVGRALAKVPDQRYPSCQEFVQALTGTATPTLRRSGLWRKVITGARGESPAPKEPAGSSTPVPNDAGAMTYPQLRHRPTADAAGVGEPPASRRVRALSPTRHGATRDTALPPDGWPAGDAAGETALAKPPGQEPHDPTPPPDTHPAPTAVTLPGYRFVSCLSQSALGDLWRAEDGQGRPRRAMCLLGYLRYDARLVNHLRALRDPALLPTEVHWSPSERLVVLSDWFEGTLRDRFEQRAAHGHAGIPRAELLRLLRTTAEALDGLYSRHGLQHLGIHPRNLLVDQDKLWLADFGLIPLVWLPTGQSAAQLNARYAAPELFDRRPSRTADQFSLALIYAEMLTGEHPRPTRHGSGFHQRTSGHGPTRTGAAMRGAKLELGLLPAPDREVVARALSPEPDKRFASCVEFIEALEAAGVPSEFAGDRYHELLAVIPFGILMGKSAHPDTLLPPVGKIVDDLTRPHNKSGDSRTVAGPRNVRYSVLPDGSWEYRCPVQLLPGSMPLKVEGFRCHWNGRLVEETADTYRLQVDVPIPRSFWERVTKQPRRLEVEIAVGPEPAASRLTEARIRVRFDSDREQQERVLGTMAPQIFESVRVYLQASAEQRRKQRWPLEDEVHVYPILPNLELGTTLVGACKDISFGGICFRVPEQPPTEYVYLHLCKRFEALGYAMLGRVVRLREYAGGWEVAARFPTADAEPAGA